MYNNFYHSGIQEQQPHRPGPDLIPGCVVPLHAVNLSHVTCRKSPVLSRYMQNFSLYAGVLMRRSEADAGSINTREIACVRTQNTRLQRVNVATNLYKGPMIHLSDKRWKKR